MTQPADPKEKACICIDIPDALFHRVEEYCKSKGISTDEFIFDAISDKLLSVHREKRRKPRL
ncbi:uncharacterized protein Dvar_77570 [Desulfosarcina variabilis str. Montpellier]|jgi:hypothetical protein|uniref:hypothetical protein n=1 Tax=Desulfosarcina variabilis TaxID=2300 RepID=UPI003AFA7231